jgi:hypothetical protein
LVTGFAARAGMQMGKAETPDTVARVFLRALAAAGTVRMLSDCAVLRDQVRACR